MTAKDNVPVRADSTISSYFRGALTSVWFGQAIENGDSCVKRFDLQPHAALCLLTMVTERVACSNDIEYYLSRVTGGGFDRVEAKVIAECGLYSLLDNRYIRLDAKGKRELSEHEHGNYGLGRIQWLLTAKAAKLMAATYCTCKGLESSSQQQAVQDMIAANKAAVAQGRKKKI